jgi:pyruvate kinase
MRIKKSNQETAANTPFLSDLLEKLLDLKMKMSLGVDEHTLNVSLLNMKQYLNLRKYDIATLQDDLTKVGLSSFGRSQGHIEASINVALEMLSRALHKELDFPKALLSYEESHAIMDKKAEIFSTSNDKTKIMITVPSDYSEDKFWFKNLSHEGVHLFRINTAHDSLQAWSKMAQAIKDEETDEKGLKIYVDLAGPKIRTSLLKAKKSSDKPQKIKVYCGDSVLISSSPESMSKKESKNYAAVVGCTLENIGGLVNIGDRVFVA